jgi:APA family basic amino acid/polyamine antiporter
MTAAPKLNAFDIGCVVVGGIVGVGIFFAPQKVAAVVDTPEQLVVAWCLGGVIALCGALVFAELSRLRPGYGGTFVYIEAAFGRLPAFLYGWANWLVIQAGALAVVGLVMVDNLDVAVHGATRQDGSRSVAITVGAIAAFTVLNALGLRLGARVQNTFTLLKMAAIFGLVALTLCVAPGHAGEAVAPRDHRGWLPALAAAMLPVLFACGGWQQGAFVAGAARRPLRDVPLGIALGVVVVVVAYLAINLAYLDLLGFDAAASSPAIAAEACRAALAPLGAGDVAARVMAGAITVSALGIMNTILLAPPWVLATMAERGVFLRACAYVHPRWHSPLVGVLVQGGCAMALLVLTHLAFAHTARGTLGTLDFLLTGVVFVDWLFFALCGLALTVLARRRPGTLLGRASPALGMVFTLFAGAVTAGAVATAPWPSLVGAGLCALGLVPYVAFFRQGI